MLIYFANRTNKTQSRESSSTSSECHTWKRMIRRRMVINGLSSMEKQKHKQQPEQEQKKWEKRATHEPRFKGLF
jgi:hypothetical protein